MDKDSDFINQIESLLFASGRDVHIGKICSIMNISSRKAKKYLEKLKERHSNESSLVVVNNEDLWKLTIRDKYNYYTKEVVKEMELDNSVVETLALIAYKNPIMQSDLVKIRGSTVYEQMKKLLEEGYVTKEKHGRSFKVKLTEKFFDYFDVDDKSKLSDYLPDEIKAKLAEDEKKIEAEEQRIDEVKKEEKEIRNRLEHEKQIEVKVNEVKEINNNDSE